MENNKIQLVKTGWSPSSQIVELLVHPGGKIELKNPTNTKVGNKIELFKDVKFESDSIKEFKDRKDFNSVDIRLLQDQRKLKQYMKKQVSTFDAAATPMLTVITTYESSIDLIGNDSKLERLFQDAVFPYLVLNVGQSMGDTFKNDLLSIQKRGYVELKQRALGDSFHPELVVGGSHADVEVGKLRSYVGFGSNSTANGNIFDTAATIGFDTTEVLVFRLQIKFNGHNVEYKGEANAIAKAVKAKQI